MARAFELARTNLGQTWPNPAVGAVIVKDGNIIAEGYTARGGRPHAETQALKNCDARGATLYVSLEPCAHHGKTPPCCDAIIAAGIARAVVACRDPHPAHGGGIDKMKAAGIEVMEGVCEAEARELNRGFISVVERGRPYVALKIASSADGKITYPLPAPLPHAGEGRAQSAREGGWITGEESRAEVHRLRSTFDAILTGIGTVLADDPLLTVRLPGLEDRSPVRVVLDRHGRMPADSQLVKTAHDVPLWVLNQPDIASALEQLAERGITRLLVEAGLGINTAFMQSGLVDRVYWFKSQQIIGESGLDAVKGSLAEMLADWDKVRETAAFGADTLEIFESSGFLPSQE